MTVKINADTTSGLQLESDTSGAIDIQSAGVTKASIDSVGNLDIQGRYSGNGNVPLFSVRMSATQTGIGDGVETKVEWDTVVNQVGVTFDTTNHRFTVPSGGAGYYQLNCFTHLRTSVDTDLLACYNIVYINGSSTVPFSQFNFSTNYVRLASPSINHILNLSEGDYVEIYAYINTVNSGSSRTINANQSGWTMHKLIT